MILQLTSKSANQVLEIGQQTGMVQATVEINPTIHNLPISAIRYWDSRTEGGSVVFLKSNKTLIVLEDYEEIGKRYRAAYRELDKVTIDGLSLEPMRKT